MPNELGELRRSQVITTYGPGAIIDFRAGGKGGGAISVVAAGLEQWDRYAGPPGLNHSQCISEPRLERKLGVRGFRLPPVTPDTGRPAQQANEDGDMHFGSLVGVRFPTVLQCPKCSTLRPYFDWAEDPGDPALYCDECSAGEGSRRIHVVPVRFILACEKGHLDDFPWDWWVGHDATCTRNGPLKLRGEGKAGLSGLIVMCTECQQRRSMEGVFSQDALSGLRCRGKRPWLAGADEACQETPRTLQRGASNLYFPNISSSLDIPPWSDPLQKALGVHWSALADVGSDEERRLLIRTLNLASTVGMEPEELLAEVKKRLELLDDPASADLRFQEYLHFTNPDPQADDPDSEFEIRTEPLPSRVEPWLQGLTRVTRLREVRALRNFTRIRPPAGDVEEGLAHFADISTVPKDWLPATEVRGEGIFILLNGEALGEWESQPSVAGRCRAIDARFQQEWRSRFGADTTAPRQITPRLLLIHSLSHALIRRLSLECGYSTTSVRERLYCSREGNEMHGLLIYTASPDSDGTLGGLARQGLPGRFAEILVASIRDMAWCSSDPLCIGGITAMSESYNNAACHSCLLLPETSCEEFNRFLDRALLVGLPDDPELGFFRGLM